MPSTKLPPESLPPDPESEARWKAMPQGQPSRQAMTPSTGGLRFSWWFVALLGLLGVVAWLAGRGG